MAAARKKLLGVGLRPKPDEGTASSKTKSYPDTGFIQGRVGVDLFADIDAQIEAEGHGSRYKSTWVRDAVVGLYEATKNETPAELAGSINLYCPPGGSPTEKTMLRVTYTTIGKHSDVVSSSKSFLNALTVLETVLDKAPSSPHNPKKTRTDILIAACKRKLAKLKSTT